MEAEWWWLQTAACHLCSLVGPSSFMCTRRNSYSARVCTLMFSLGIPTHSSCVRRAPVLYLQIAQCGLTCNDRAWIRLHKSRRCPFKNSGSVFHAFCLSRKEAEIFLVETLDQENIIVKKSCGMWRWNWSLPKWQGNIFIPVTAMWYCKNVSSWAKAVGASNFCNTQLIPGVSSVSIKSS